MNWKALLQAALASALQASAGAALQHVEDPKKTSWKDLGKTAGTAAAFGAIMGAAGSLIPTPAPASAE
jgi:hypothetical protein